MGGQQRQQAQLGSGQRRRPGDARTAFPGQLCLECPGLPDESAEPGRRLSRSSTSRMTVLAPAGSARPHQALPRRSGAGLSRRCPPRRPTPTRRPGRYPWPTATATSSCRIRPARPPRRPGRGRPAPDVRSGPDDTRSRAVPADDRAWTPKGRTLARPHPVTGRPADTPRSRPCPDGPLRFTSRRRYAPAGVSDKSPAGFGAARRASRMLQRPPTGASSSQARPDHRPSCLPMRWSCWIFPGYAARWASRWGRWSQMSVLGAMARAPPTLALCLASSCWDDARCPSQQQSGA